MALTKIISHVPSKGSKCPIHTRPDPDSRNYATDLRLASDWARHLVQKKAGGVSGERFAFVTGLGLVAADIFKSRGPQLLLPLLLTLMLRCHFGHATAFAAGG